MTAASFWWSAEELMGRIIDKQVDKTALQAVFFDINSDQRNMNIPLDDEYTILLSGNDTGTMYYTVTETDLSIGKVMKNEFSDVTTSDEKTASQSFMTMDTGLSREQETC